MDSATLVSLADQTQALLASSRLTNRRLVLLACGSFNPPTIMHLRMIEVATDFCRQMLNSNVVEQIFSPTSDHYAKPGLVSHEHRFQMMQLALLGNYFMRADRWEGEQTQYTTTLSVLRHHQKEVRKRYGDDVLVVFVCGGDLVETFNRTNPDGTHVWDPKDIHTIVKDFGLLIMRRPGSFPEKTLHEMGLTLTGNVFMLDDPACPCDISSTRLRTSLLLGQSIKYCTPEPVIDYIRSHSLYDIRQDGK